MDHALESSGASIVFATSADENYPGDNIIDGKESTFWSTTGLFPQELIIKLKDNVSISKVKMLSSAVRKLVLEKCESANCDRFEKVFEVELQDKDNRLQTESHQVNFTAQFVKFTIISSWDDFCAINKVSLT
mmetsp:Transcript_25670/g.35457  ORF Transcript_25670/g.35457 Transcript_25670/m.35457 type:complete len:132 (+) Transcript_25670:49-444(+)|eukprot:CAMPEP_0196594498 /NCGR_PEP_ID=MMETSP1081-20130531/78549_1 /TAXON_ID=36882 /ORGANISM="Pyramimonas amylifera, Strain CCMP720" /LENGTH=131 /DNA_ID=CAMNT_0041918787 /DNA_START=104 /DNA_END=499 /DNA_ORIENTATION=+